MINIWLSQMQLAVEKEKLRIRVQAWRANRIKVLANEKIHIELDKVRPVDAELVVLSGGRKQR